MAAAHISPKNTDDLSELQAQQRAAVEQYRQQLHDYEEHEASGSHIHPDLQDLSFGSLGNEEGKLPPPMRPTSRHATSAEWDQGRGSLSDFSDYESEEEEERRNVVHRPAPSSRVHSESMVDAKDPFADPFGDWCPDILGVSVMGIYLIYLRYVFIVDLFWWVSTRYYIYYTALKVFDTCARLLCDSWGNKRTNHPPEIYLTVQFTRRHNKILVFNHFQYRYPFQCSLVLHFEELRRSSVGGVGGHLAAAVAVAADVEEPSLLPAYSRQELQNLARVQRP
jgi:hypothetical protein